MKHWLAVAALVLVPAVAPAAEMDTAGALSTVTVDDLPNIGVGFNIGFQDLVALAPYPVPGPPAYNGTTSGAVLTFGATYRNRLGSSPNWYLEAGAGYGKSSAKLEDSGPSPFEFKESLTAVYGNAGAGYVQMLTKSTGVYGSGRLFYSTVKAKWEDDTDEFESESFNTFGFEPAIGCTHKLGAKTSWYGEFYQQFGWGSGEVGDVKYTTTLKNSCWRGGLLFHF